MQMRLLKSLINLQLTATVRFDFSEIFLSTQDFP